MPPLGSLKIFVTAAESSSFSAAARKLGRTPAAVSKSIGLLEDQLNIRLFNRTTRQLQLTTDGRAFYDSTRHALVTFDSVVEQLSASRGQPSGPIRISMTPSFGRLYVLPLLGAFIGRYPFATAPTRRLRAISMSAYSGERSSTCGTCQKSFAACHSSWWQALDISQKRARPERPQICAITPA